MALPPQTHHVDSDDGIMIIQDGCIRWITYDEFASTISLGGFSICAAVINCFENMGYFDDYIPPIDTPPIFTDIYLNLANRTQDYVLISDLFLQHYYDADGDAFSKIIITGGDLSGITYNNQPVYLGLVINADELLNFKYDAKDMDGAYQQVLEIEVYDENNVKAN
ncbi:hypothetical protein [uncultured Chryseobacterium sp.]|uniref:hypothetical protein n=1 Tax=uncultured Chryseobacterium sp. TaxID=259322 RepID=UPI0025F95418|nr:hypothetical protein [uncultured Chryseobacterium sp.]